MKNSDTNKQAEALALKINDLITEHMSEDKSLPIAIVQAMDALEAQLAAMISANVQMNLDAMRETLGERFEEEFFTSREVAFGTASAYERVQQMVLMMVQQQKDLKAASKATMN